MASQYTTSNGVTLIVPGAYAEAQVVSTPSAVAANGILMVIGEADSGPSYAEEEDITQNAFGPDQKAEIIAKYGTGQLVDAFVGAVAASNDANITGSFTRFVPVKTNTSVAASTTIPAIGGGSYANVVAKAAGKPGNLITRQITAEQSEVIPTTGAFVLASPQVSTVLSARVNGGAEVQTADMAIGATPTSMVSDIAAVTGIIATGGVARSVVTGAHTVTVGGISGYSCTFTNTTDYDAIPTAGDIMLVPTGSAFATANEGTYVVQAASARVITALKVIDAAGAGATRTAPSADADVSISSSSDLECYSPVTISLEAGAVLPGCGKSMELYDDTSVSSSGLFSDLAWSYTASTQALAKTGKISTATTPVVVVSSAEYEVNFNTVRQRDSISEEIVVGGSPVLSVGYAGTTASMVIASGVMTLTLAGGSSASLSPITITLSDYPTIGDLCQYLNSLGGFTAAPTLVTYTSIDPTNLDEGTYGFATENGAKTGRIKTDGADFLAAVNAESVLVDIEPVIAGTNLVGLPDVASLGFLSGGSRGATTNADVQGALDAIQAIKGNLVVPLFSNDAAVDIAADVTDASSTYDIASINSAVRAHCLQMSQLKRRRRRIAILSNYDSFANDEIAAANTASERCVMVFQNVRDNNSTGTLTTFKPWMAAIKAASMQAAGFYKDITHKYIAISAATVPGGGFSYNINSNLEDALTSGLLPIVYDGSGYKWVSDQTTYSVDDNFVRNSLQAMYILDIVTATAEERMERAFVGQSLADVSAETGKTVFKAICDDLMRLKLIASSDDAPRGVKNVVVKVVNGNALVVSCEIKLATSIKFVPITFMVSAIQQTATG
jgi:hypothetical protein